MCTRSALSFRLRMSDRSLATSSPASKGSSNEKFVASFTKNCMSGNCCFALLIICSEASIPTTFASVLLNSFVNSPVPQPTSAMLFSRQSGSFFLKPEEESAGPIRGKKGA